MSCEIFEHVEKFCPRCDHRFAADGGLVSCPNDGAELLLVTEDAMVGAVVAGKYRIGDLIGSGGWSRVYLAEHSQLGRTVAFKLLRADLVANAERIQRFDSEARLLSSLTHPHICCVYDCGIMDSGQPYLVLEYVQGKSLADVLAEEGSLEPARAVRLLKQMASGLQVAHEKGIVHRDFKPGNVMVIGAGNDEAIKIIDFGLSKTLDEDREQLTNTGMTVGTPCYMSPEQVCGHVLDLRSDIYSFGCVAYELLTGRKPVERDSVFETMQAHINQSPPLMTNDKWEVPKPLEELTLCCLEKVREDRYQSMAEVGRALASFERSGKISKPKGQTFLPALATKMKRAGRKFFVPANLVVVLPVVAALCLIPLFIALQPTHKSAAMQKFLELRHSPDTAAAEAFGKQLFAQMESKRRKQKPAFIELCEEMQRLYTETGHQRDSIPFIKAELAARTEDASPDSVEYLQAYDDAANSFLAFNDVDALPYVQKVEQLVAAKYSYNSARYCEALSNLAWCEFRAEDAIGSEKDHIRLVDLVSKFYHSSDPLNVRSLHHLAVVQLHLRKYAEADATCDRAVPLISERTPGDVQRDLLQAAAHAAEHCQKYDKAIETYKRALSVSQKVSLTQADVIESDLALCLVEAKRYAEAEPVLLDALNHISKRWGSECDLYQLCLGKYVQALRATNQTKKADAVAAAGKV